MLNIPPPGSNLQRWFKANAGIDLDPSISDLRDQQREVLEWLVSRPEPYLFVNAPTGSGKTLLAQTYGVLRQVPSTYAVHTIMLQEQVARTFTNLPVLTGRSNHPCWVGEQIYGVGGDYTAAQGVCVIDRAKCSHSTKTGEEAYQHDDLRGLCPYYAQQQRALYASHRVANYAMLLSYPPLQQKTKTLLADEGHNIEEAVVGQAAIVLNKRTLGRFSLRCPKLTPDMGDWKAWALEALSQLPQQDDRGRPDWGLKGVTDALSLLALRSERDTGQWLIAESEREVAFTPIWGRDFVMSRLFNHDEAPSSSDLYDATNERRAGIDRVLLVSATLMGPEYIAATLGFPEGSWAYLDLPSTFPVANRPINYAPVAKMNFENRAESRVVMQQAIDRLIEYYVLNSQPTGIIHAVSNEYRDYILTNSRWSRIMHTTTEEHETAIRRGEASVLVAANVTEGYDGTDGLCRFVLMPKVPFPSLGDARTKIRMSEDSRSYDHRTLVSVVQGAGRGVRHRKDYCDTWILDSSWSQLFARARSWLPDSFLSAYHHNVGLV